MLTALLLAAVQAASADSHTVEPVMVIDEKAVFATVESVDVVGARARIGGVIGELLVDEGDLVEAGDIIAVVVDDRLAPQIGAANATAAALTAQLEQARTDLNRAQDLFDRGIFAQARLDEAQTAVDVLENQLASARQGRAVLVQQTREGDVLAPTAGRILEVPVTAGTVVLPGENIASVASDLYVLRLMLPERHARSISEGDTIRVDGSALTGDVAPTGFIRQVYPRIEDGRVIADAVVEGLGTYFVGERVRVLVGVDEREAIRIPSAYLSTRYGVDYVRVSEGDGGSHEVVVQIGASSDGQVEILSGLSAGDVLVQQ
ncbi:efflux RND transporter periplasmic adaptor subunit [Hyphobacterium sp. HN65]|uniref:Efflux RND transporter periplasmic adaptor subunit n=1 Tax=Hyphobacterium lacteum TaxID=3116575 RepID=A0ABU7LQF9_9PROT|nr:efflux RND transporter periplasmic adaptor subunit [Hyphobacterium sp. HN65]MEE2526151.1 efflux RND transporter periplasmic adaptor subunit [Hyphobacterium sp. HN65]